MESTHTWSVCRIHTEWDPHIPCVDPHMESTHFQSAVATMHQATARSCPKPSHCNLIVTVVVAETAQYHYFVLFSAPGQNHSVPFHCPILVPCVRPLVEMQSKSAERRGCNHTDRLSQLQIRKKKNLFGKARLTSRLPAARRVFLLSKRRKEGGLLGLGKLPFPRREAKHAVLG